MNLAVEQFYQEIGQAAKAVAPDLAGRLLIYAEVEDGAVSADIFYATATGVRFRICPQSMKGAIYSFWKQWTSVPGNREWRVMCYVIDDGKFSIDFTYPDQIKANEGLPDRRPLAAKRYFGDVKVDYSKPK